MPGIAESAWGPYHVCSGAADFVTCESGYGVSKAPVALRLTMHICSLILDVLTVAGVCAAWVGEMVVMKEKQGNCIGPSHLGLVRCWVMTCQWGMVS